MQIHDLVKKKIYIVEMSVPWDANIQKKFDNKSIKYAAIRAGLKKQFPEFVHFSPLHTSQLATISCHLLFHFTQLFFLLVILI